MTIFPINVFRASLFGDENRTEFFLTTFAGVSIVYCLSFFSSSERVDALCHHHAAQQALMGMQSHSMCPHMQQHYLSMSPSELHQSPVPPAQSSSRTRSSPTGSDSNSSNARKSSAGQGLWVGGEEKNTKDSSSVHSRTTAQCSPHTSRATAESHDLDDFDPDDSGQHDRQRRSSDHYKRERSGSYKVDA